MENEVAALFLEYSSTKLDVTMKDMRACVERLTDEQVWERHGAHENAVGNLVLHLCGNMRQWVMHGVGKAEDVRIRDAEFNADGELTGVGLIELFEKTVAEARGVINSLPAERLVERITPQGRNVAVLEAIYQVVGHVQQHMGQIILLTKQMTRQDLDLTMPRPR
jgi:uncharacterized damage-inducible protein DinB